MIKRNLCLLVLCLLMAGVIYAQEKACHKYVPYFRSLDAQKLAVRLTSHLDSDSARVCAIHSWITHHIKYDYRKFASFDYDKVPVSRILRSRKAVCEGYASLFNELCTHAGIVSVSVSGYARNTGTDLNDRFYMEDHAWNAVKIDGKWRLVDACWDAGYIRYYRKTFGGYLLSGISIGRVSAERYHPRFVPRPSTRYFNRSGSYFICDHIPADPAWQLLEQEQSLEALEQDSCFYLREAFREDRVEAGMPAGEDERSLQLALSAEERVIRHGFAAYRFNHKNQYPLASSFSRLSEKVFAGTDFRSKDTSRLNMQCDSIMIQSARAVFHFDSNEVLLALQKEALSLNNKKKKELMSSHTGFLTASSKQALRFVQSGVKSSRRLTAGAGRLAASGKSNISRLDQQQAYHKALPAVKSRPGDSAVAAVKIALYADTIAELDGQMSRRIAGIRSFLDTCLQRIGTYRDFSGKNTVLTKFAILRRMENHDDLDLPVRMVKDTVLAYKFRSSGLLLDENVFLMNRLVKELRQLDRDYRRLYALHHKTVLLYASLKRSCSEEHSPDDQYQAFLAAYRVKIASYQSGLDHVKPGARKLENVCRASVRTIEAEVDAYRLERDVETSQYAARSRYILRKHASLKRLNSKGRRQSMKLYNKARNTKERMTGH